MNWKFFFQKKKKEQITFGECLLTFGPDCFVFPFAIKQHIIEPLFYVVLARA
jgi:hypothetical protein